MCGGLQRAFSDAQTVIWLQMQYWKYHKLPGSDICVRWRGMAFFASSDFLSGEIFFICRLGFFCRLGPFLSVGTFLFDWNFFFPSGFVRRLGFSFVDWDFCLSVGIFLAG